MIGNVKSQGFPTCFMKCVKGKKKKTKTKKLAMNSLIQIYRGWQVSVQFCSDEYCTKERNNSPNRVYMCVCVCVCFLFIFFFNYLITMEKNQFSDYKNVVGFFSFCVINFFHARWIKWWVTFDQNHLLNINIYTKIYIYLPSSLFCFKHVHDIQRRLLHIVAKAYIVVVCNVIFWMRCYQTAAVLIADDVVVCRHSFIEREYIPCAMPTPVCIPIPFCYIWSNLNFRKNLRNQKSL